MSDGSQEGNLTVLLVHDPLATLSAASMHVATGTLDNSEARGFAAGEAHFLEHMLFLGSEKFPGEAQFASQLASHSGFDNAFTASDETVYFFVVSSAGLNATIDIWAQFFVAPLLTAASASKEALAVSAEHAKNINNDEWRRFALIKNLANDSSAFHRFGTGTYMSLLGKSGPPVTDAEAGKASDSLRKFFNWHYVPPNLKLVILSSASLDELQAVAVSSFSSICEERSAATRASLEAAAMLGAGAFPFAPERLVNPFGKEFRGRWVHAKPEVSSLRRLTVYFPIQELTDWRLKPLSLLSTLFSREDPRSLLAHLRESGLATSIDAYTEEKVDEFSLLAVEVALSPAGSETPELVVGKIFAFVRFLVASNSPTASPIAEFIRERAALAELDWRFSDRPQPDDAVVALSSSLAAYGVREVLRGDSLIYGVENDDDQFSLSAAAVHSFIEKWFLDPSQAIVILELDSPFSSIAVRKSVPYYGVEYTNVPMSVDLLGRLNNASLPTSVTWPRANEFVPTDFGVLPASDPQPVSLPDADQGSSQLHQTAGLTFNSPKLDVYVRLNSPVFVSRSAENEANLAVFVSSLSALANERFGAASEAGASFSIGRSSNGLTVKVSGYSDPNSSAQLIRSLASLVTNWTALVELGIAKTAPDQRSAVISSIASSERDLAVRVALMHQRRLLSAPLAPAPSSVRAILEHRQVTGNADKDELQALKDICLAAASQSKLVFLSVGNIDEADAASIAADVKARLFSEGGEAAYWNGQLKPRTPLLSDGSRFLFLSQGNADERNSAVTLYMQLGRSSRATEQERALMQIISPVLYQRAFAQLRTIDGLGYIVWAYARPLHDVGTAVIAVQSATASNAKVARRIEHFLSENFVPFVDAVCRGESSFGNETLPSFSELVDAAVATRNVAPVSLSALASTQWSAVSSGSFDFYPESARRDSNQLRSVSCADLSQFVHRYMDAEASEHRRLMVWVQPTEEEGSTFAGSSESNRRSESQKIISTYNQIDINSIYEWQDARPLSGAILNVKNRLILEREVAEHEAMNDQPSTTASTAVASSAMTPQQESVATPGSSLPLPPHVTVPPAGCPTCEQVVCPTMQSAPSTGNVENITSMEDSMKLNTIGIVILVLAVFELVLIFYLIITAWRKRSRPHSHFVQLDDSLDGF